MGNREFSYQKEEKKQTAGEASLKAAAADVQTDFIELEREINKGSNSERSYEEEVWLCVDRGRKSDRIKGDFYVEVICSQEIALKNVIRRRFLFKQACPTPNYDQAVYKYFRKDDEIEFLWSLPNKMASAWLQAHRFSLPADQLDLLKFVDDFKNGDLEKKCILLNGEKKKDKIIPLF